jgi:hypothetical protein
MACQPEFTSCFPLNENAWVGMRTSLFDLDTCILQLNRPDIQQVVFCLKLRVH